MDTDEHQPINTGKKSPECWRPLNWSELGKALGVSRQRAVYVHDELMIKLRDAILDDPLLREWAEENGYDLSEYRRSDTTRDDGRVGKDASRRSRNPK